jgi:hypothetical protein
MKKYIIFMLYLQYSCNPAPNCRGNVSLGNVTLKGEDKVVLLSYKDKAKVFFKDSLGSELELSSNYDNGFENNIAEIEDRECSNEAYTSDLEFILISMTNNVHNLSMRFRVSMRLTGAQWSTEHEEVLHVYMSKLVPKPNELGIGIFYETIFEKDKVKILQKKNINLFGKNYDNVLVDKDDTNPKCYLHESVGILAFRDFDNKLWVFDRFE